jgi:hypothetical protein
MLRKLLAVLLFSFCLVALPLVVNAQKEIKADKVTRGRTADEKVYEYVVPANEWVVTSLWIAPNQEVMIHHFTSNERVTVKLGALNDSRLQRAGTILPLYTSRNCSTDRGVNAKVPYTCVQLSKSEGIKLFARNSVRVGVVVKDR